MNIRDAIYKAGESGKIRLGDKVFKIEGPEESLTWVGVGDEYIFTVVELISLEWESLSTEWKKDKDE